MADLDRIDPLDAAFSNPKAGKKLNDGQRLPGMDQAADISIEPDTALSRALDDAFSKSKFEPRSEPQMDLQPDSALAAAAEEKLARSLDDAFANPKLGEKIKSPHMDDGVSPEHLGLRGYQGGDLMLDRPAPKGGLASPKFLVIGLMLLVVIIVAIMAGGGDPQPAKPNVIRLTD